MKLMNGSTRVALLTPDTSLMARLTPMTKELLIINGPPLDPCSTGIFELRKLIELEVKVAVEEFAEEDSLEALTKPRFGT